MKDSLDTIVQISGSERASVTTCDADSSLIVSSQTLNRGTEGCADEHIRADIEGKRARDIH